MPFLLLPQSMLGLGLLLLNSSIFLDVLTTMLHLLRGLNAWPVHALNRFKISAVNNVVMEAKLVVLQTLDFALDMQAEDQVRMPSRSKVMYMPCLFLLIYC